MPRFATALFALLLLGGCQRAAPSPVDTPRVALWTIEGPAGAKGWLIGTVHALPSGTRWRNPAIDRAMASANLLVLEIGEDLDADSAGAALARLAMTPGLPPPSERLGPGPRADLVRAYSRLGLDDTRFAGEESWAVALQIAAIAGQRDGMDPANGVEPQLRKAMAGKPVTGLETIDGQFAIFDGLPNSAQTVLLGDIAHDAASTEPADGDDDDKTMLGYWLKGDQNGLSREATSGFLADPELHAALLTGRNRAWAGRIDTLLRQGQHPFIAVGTAHVAGHDGLPDLLAARGWRVTRVE